MITEFQRLIDDLEELKSTRLYENSFKAIDDCIYLLYSRKNYFESFVIGSVCDCDMHDNYMCHLGECPACWLKV